MPSIKCHYQRLAVGWRWRVMCGEEQIDTGTQPNRQAAQRVASAARKAALV